MRRTLEGAGTLSFTRLALEGVESSTRGVLERDGAPLRDEGVLLRDEGAVLRDEGAGLGVALRDGVTLREGEDARGDEGAGEGVLERGDDGAEEDLPLTRLPPLLEGELLREPLEGTEPPLARDPPEGAAPPLLEPLEPRPPIERCASVGVASMLMPSTRKAQTVRYLRVFMNGLEFAWAKNRQAQT